MALVNAAESYRQRTRTEPEARLVDPYPTLNWLTWAAVLRQDVPDDR